MKLTFPALAHRNFRLYLAGQGVSIVGFWMQQVALAWLVFELSGSAVWLGLVAFAGQIPALILAPLSGSLIDCSDRHRLVLLTQTLAMLMAFLLAVLTVTGTVAIWHILVLNLILGVVNAFDTPARQSLLSEMVSRREDLANAIALNSTVWNGARLTGPMLASLLLLATNPGVCFLVNGLSYLAVLAALLAMRLPERRRSAVRGRLLGNMREGLAYAWRSEPIRSLLLLIALFQMAGLAQMTLLPIIASSVLQGNGSMLGLLTASTGLGALAAAVFLASKRSIDGLGRWIVGATLVFSLGLLAFSFAGTVLMAVLLLSTTGFALLLLTAGANTLMQTIVAEDKRGRVLSLYTMAVTGLAPMGGLAAGLLADKVGAPLTLRLAGFACLAGSLFFALRTASVNSVNHAGPSPESLPDQRETDLVYVTLASGSCRRAG
ncbi:MAG TPA: MFS transporter [Gemmataceae bacterium]|nr:MFS transporter [Gemmataceae bacterium]